MSAKSEAAFDLTSIDTIAACNKAIEIEIQHPVTKAGTGFFVSIVGKDSDIYRGRVRAMADENMDRQARMQQRNKLDIPKLAKLEAKNIDTMVAATVDWRTESEKVAFLDGEKLPFTAANARKVYERILPVREQVQEAINDIENFMPG